MLSKSGFELFWFVAGSTVYGTMSNSSFSSPGASPSRVLSKELLDICGPIKDQFQKMAIAYGEESFDDLYKAVVVALEELERYKQLYDDEQERCDELKSNIEKLEKDLQYRREERTRMQQDIVMTEENSQEELSKAYDILNNLKSENKRLRQKIESVDYAQEAMQDADTSTSVEDTQVMVDLRKKYLKEHEQVREYQEQLAFERQQIEELRSNVEKLYSQNKELLRKNKSLVAQGKTVIMEKTELSRKLDKLNREYIRTTNALNEASLTCQDLESESASRSGSDVPKFTENELQDLFMSKVKLIERISELELQLERMKMISPAESERLDDTLSRPSSTASVVSQKSSSNDEYLVYGPINKEPDEKLYPWKNERKRESGVRKFFSSIFKSSSPRRGSNINVQ